MNYNIKAIKKIVEDSGAEYVDIGTYDGINYYVMFNDPKNHSSLTIMIKDLSHYNVVVKMIKNRLQYMRAIKRVVI